MAVITEAELADCMCRTPDYTFGWVVGRERRVAAGWRAVRAKDSISTKLDLGKEKLTLQRQKPPQGICGFCKEETDGACGGRTHDKTDK